VSMMIPGYGLGGRGSIPGRVNIFLVSAAYRPDLETTQPTIQCVPGEAISLGVKRQGREVDHLSSSTAKIKNGGPIHPCPSYAFME
jgi:hypothetical protein